MITPRHEELVCTWAALHVSLTVLLMRHLAQSAVEQASGFGATSFSAFSHAGLLASAESCRLLFDNCRRLQVLLWAQLGVSCRQATPRGSILARRAEHSSICKQFPQPGSASHLCCNGRGHCLTPKFYPTRRPNIQQKACGYYILVSLDSPARGWANASLCAT